MSLGDRYAFTLRLFFEKILLTFSNKLPREIFLNINFHANQLTDCSSFFQKIIDLKIIQVDQLYNSLHEKNFFKQPELVWLEIVLLLLIVIKNPM